MTARTIAALLFTIAAAVVSSDANARGAPQPDIRPMATDYPTTIQTFTNPDATTSMRAGESNPHHTLTATVSDTVEALQAKVGVDSSADTGSLDYRVGELELQTGTDGTIYQISDVATTGQTRTMDFANGRVQTLAANNDFQMNITATGLFGWGFLYVYNNSGVGTIIVTPGPGFAVITEMGNPTSVLLPVTDDWTAVYRLYWDGEKALLFLYDTYVGMNTDQRPTPP